MKSTAEMTIVAPLYHFDAPYDSLARFLSMFIPAVLIIGTFVIFHIAQEEMNIPIKLLFIGFIVVIIIIPYLFSPRGYTIDNLNLIVHFFLWHIRIPYSDIENISFDPDLSLSLHRRLVGSSGYFGYWGIYNLPNIGKVSVWTNTRKSVVFIYRKNKRPLIVGPNNIENFTAELNQYTTR